MAKIVTAEVVTLAKVITLTGPVVNSFHVYDVAVFYGLQSYMHYW